ncbi:hypothetical protein ACSBR1_027661 [Camellia fascicularis]
MPRIILSSTNAYGLSLSLSLSLSLLYSNPKPMQLRLFLLLSLSSSHPSRCCAILSIVFIKPPEPSSLHRHHQITGAVVGGLDSQHLPEKHLSLSLSLCER